MKLASAYPSDVLSPLMMAAIVLAVAVGLGAWLILVFLADRQSGARETGQAGRPTPVPAAPDQAAEDEQGEAGRAAAAVRHGAAA